MSANCIYFCLLLLSLYFVQNIVQFNIYAPEEFLFHGIFRKQIESEESTNVESSFVDSEQTESENAAECSISPSNAVLEVCIIIIL